MWANRRAGPRSWSHKRNYLTIAYIATVRNWRRPIAITVILFALIALLSADEGESNLAGSAFFLLMISLIVTLFDRYRPVRPRLTDDPGFATVPVGT